METVELYKLNDTFLYIKAHRSIEMELNEYFKFRVPGYQFMPKYKSRMWDGYLRLWKLNDKTIYLGLWPAVIQFCKERNYEYIVDPKILEYRTQKIEQDEVAEFIKGLKLPFKEREYQTTGFKHAIFNKRCLLVSPTGSGKSVLIYEAIRWFNNKTLLIVPTTSLVEQMYTDFGEYSKNDPTFDNEKMCHRIYSGQSKTTDKQIIISTWQSLQRQKAEYFHQFQTVIGDEVHGFKAKELTRIMESCVNASNRIGATGTLDGTLTHKLVLEGLFGSVFDVTTTKKLMDSGYLSELSIDCIVMKYDESETKIIKNLKYQQEVKYITKHTGRNNFIANLMCSMKSNSLVLFQFIEHGKELERLILEKLKQTQPNRKVFFVAGETKVEIREEVRKITETEKDAIIVASVGVFSTGVNIKNLNNIVFASPSKSRIRTLQSIGRVLRVGNSNKAKLYDLVDDFKYKSYTNFALKHFVERLNIYSQQKFDYKLHKIKIQKSTHVQPSNNKTD